MILSDHDFPPDIRVNIKKTIEFRKKFNREVETKELAEIFDRILERVKCVE